MKIEIYFCLFFYIIVCGAILRLRSPIISFFFLIYTVQFWPVFFGVFSDFVVFWPVGGYTYRILDPNFYSILTVFVFTLLGFFGVAVTFSVFSRQLVRFQSGEEIYLCRALIPNFVSFLILAFLLLFLTINFFYSLEERFSGYHLLVPLLILSVFISALVKGSYSLVLICCAVIGVYVFDQVLSGDRDFMTLFAAILIFFFSFFNLKRRSILFLFGIAGLFLFSGIVISILRQGSGLSFSKILQYLAFNSWSGVIKPLIDMIEAEGLDLNLLFGETYFYLVASFAPSFFYEALGTIKPFLNHNPAHWYHVSGGGGMHAAGVALKNFGLFGVFVQPIVFSIVLMLINLLCVKFNRFSSYLLFSSVALVLMKAVWYSLLTFVNTMFFLGGFLILLFFIKKILPSKSKSRGASFDYRY